MFDERRPFHLKSTILTVLLLILMVAPIPITSQIYRPIVTFVGFLIVLVGEKEPCLFLDNRAFKLISQIAFACYFCFWPLLTLYKYCFKVHWYVVKQGEFLGSFGIWGGKENFGVEEFGFFFGWVLLLSPNHKFVIFLKFYIHVW